MELLAELRQITLGLLWFQQHDDAVPAAERGDNLKFGLCADEFAEEDHFPRQLYIREARRLVGRSRLIERSLVQVEPNGRPPLLRDAVAVGSFAIDSFPCTTGLPALEQRSGATAMEGYVGMNTALVAPSTLPAAMMLPASPHNLIVPTAVSASHVAFSAVRLEPTWMMLGSAAGLIAHLSLQGLALAPAELDVARVRLVDTQRLIIAQGQPLAYFSDLVVGDPGWQALQLIAPHAFEAAEGFAAQPAATLPRAMAVHWIAAALRAANSTLGRMAPSGALLPVPGSGKDWPDYHRNDTGFAEAAALAAAGAVTPAPGFGQAFQPHLPIALTEMQAWVRSAAALLPEAPHNTRIKTLKSERPSRGDDDRATRAQAAALVVEALLGGGLYTDLDMAAYQ